jgi:hypothetical protein
MSSETLAKWNEESGFVMYVPGNSSRDSGGVSSQTSLLFIMESENCADWLRSIALG